MFRSGVCPQFKDDGGCIRRPCNSVHAYAVMSEVRTSANIQQQSAYPLKHTDGVYAPSPPASLKFLSQKKGNKKENKKLFLKTKIKSKRGPKTNTQQKHNRCPYCGSNPKWFGSSDCISMETVVSCAEYSTKGLEPCGSIFWHPSCEFVSGATSRAL